MLHESKYATLFDSSDIKGLEKINLGQRDSIPGKVFALQEAALIQFLGPHIIPWSTPGVSPEKKALDLNSKTKSKLVFLGSMCRKREWLKRTFLRALHAEDPDLALSTARNYI